MLEICGEAMNGLYRIAPAVAEKIPHSRDIIGFRNILAHGYTELDHNKVYDIAMVRILLQLYGTACSGKFGGLFCCHSRNPENAGFLA